MHAKWDIALFLSLACNGSFEVDWGWVINCFLLELLFWHIRWGSSPWSADCNVLHCLLRILLHYCFCLFLVFYVYSWVKENVACHYRLVLSKSVFRRGSQWFSKRWTNSFDNQMTLQNCPFYSPSENWTPSTHSYPDWLSFFFLLRKMYSYAKLLISLTQYQNISKYAQNYNPKLSCR